jgi:hypothetical protein
MEHHFSWIAVRLAFSIQVSPFPTPIENILMTAGVQLVILD